MFSFLKQCSILLGLVCGLSMAPQAPAATQDSIADFIKAHRRKPGIVVNTPKYDPNATVFFLFYLGYNAHQQDKLEAITKPLIPVHKKMAGSGAELVMYLDFPPAQQSGGADSKKGKTRRQATTDKRSLAVKCPVLNVFHSETREVLFKKDARGKEQSYGTYDLRATDAKGIPLAYFSYDQGEIMMRDATTGEKKSIGKGTYTGNEWVGPAILASYRELVGNTAPEKAAAKTQSPDADDAAKAPSTKKGKKKSDKKRKSKDL